MNPTIYVSVIWRSILSFDSGSEGALDDWNKNRHELSSQHCAMIKSFRWIGIKIQDPPECDGRNGFHGFLHQNPSIKE